MRLVGHFRIVLRLLTGRLSVSHMERILMVSLSVSLNIYISVLTALYHQAPSFVIPTIPGAERANKLNLFFNRLYDVSALLGQKHQQGLLGLSTIISHSTLGTPPHRPHACSQPSPKGATAHLLRGMQELGLPPLPHQPALFLLQLSIDH